VSAAVLLLMSVRPVDAKDFTVVAFGTSLTARGGWPAALEDALGRCLKQPVSVVVVAQPGATSDWAVGAADRVFAARPDVVLVEMSANDAAFHRLVSMATSRRNMSAIFKRLAALEPRPRVFNMAMNPVSGVRGLDRFFLDRYVNLHRKLALQSGGAFIDHGPAWASLPPSQLQAAIPDGLHPTPQISAEVMVPGLVKAIAGRACAT